MSRILYKLLSGSQRQGLSSSTQGSSDLSACINDVDSKWYAMPVIWGWTDGKYSPTSCDAFKEHAPEDRCTMSYKKNEAMSSLAVETLQHTWLPPPQ